MIFGELIREMWNLVTFVFSRGRHQSPDCVSGLSPLIQQETYGNPDVILIDFFLTVDTQLNKI